MERTIVNPCFIGTQSPWGTLLREISRTNEVKRAAEVGSLSKHRHRALVRGHRPGDLMCGDRYGKGGARGRSGSRPLAARCVFSKTELDIMCEAWVSSFDVRASSRARESGRGILRTVCHHETVSQWDLVTMRQCHNQTVPRQGGVTMSLFHGSVWLRCNAAAFEPQKKNDACDMMNI